MVSFGIAKQHGWKSLGSNDLVLATKIKNVWVGMLKIQRESPGWIISRPKDLLVGNEFASQHNYLKQNNNMRNARQIYTK